MRNTWLIAGLVLVQVAVASVAFATLPPGGTFIDDDGHIFEGDIEAIAAEGITKGCNPPTNDKYCPNDRVTRGEMAVFLVRAMGYSDNGGGNLFVDDDGFFYENAADKLFTAGVTLGCNPPVNNKYCGEANVTRGQMAAFLVRAMGYKDNGGGNLFVDDDGHLFENDIANVPQVGPQIPVVLSDRAVYFIANPAIRTPYAHILDLQAKGRQVHLWMAQVARFGEATATSGRLNSSHPTDTPPTPIAFLDASHTRGVSAS